MFDQGKYDRALVDFSESIQLDPEDAYALRAMATILTTCPNDRFRDGKRAVELATKACELRGWMDGDDIDTLAAAYAQAGDFQSAVKWQEKALELTPAKKDDYRSRLNLYKSGNPYHDQPKE